MEQMPVVTYGWVQALSTAKPCGGHLQKQPLATCVPRDMHAVHSAIRPPLENAPSQLHNNHKPRKVVCHGLSAKHQGPLLGPPNPCFAEAAMKDKDDWKEMQDALKAAVVHIHSNTRGIRADDPVVVNLRTVYIRLLENCGEQGDLQLLSWYAQLAACQGGAKNPTSWPSLPAGNQKGRDSAKVTGILLTVTEFAFDTLPALISQDVESTVVLHLLRLVLHLAQNRQQK